MATSPLDDDFARQMELLKDVDPSEVNIPEAKMQDPPQSQEMSELERLANKAVERTGTNMLTPEAAPEVFANAAGSGVERLIQLVEDLPRKIAQELKNG